VGSSDLDNENIMYWEGFMSPVVDTVTDEVIVAIVEGIIEFLLPIEDTADYTGGELLYVAEVSNLEMEYPVLFSKYKADLLN